MRYVKGDMVFRAAWARHGLRVEEGLVEMAGEAQFIVRVAGQWTESVSQRDGGGWRSTRAEALLDLLGRLESALRRAEADVLGLRAKITSTRTARAHMEDGNACC